MGDVLCTADRRVLTYQGGGIALDAYGKPKTNKETCPCSAPRPVDRRHGMIGTATI